MPKINILTCFTNKVSMNSKAFPGIRICDKNNLSTRAHHLNQGTNGPVNAHLISGPTVSTKTSKIGQGQPRVIIYIIFVELESPILHAKFQDHRPSGSGEEDF